MTAPYDDIINLPHPTSQKHPRMPRTTRAAQFAPFAALTGYNEAIRETSRLTDEQLDLDDTMKASLNEKLLLIKDRLPDQPEISITFFVPDTKKPVVPTKQPPGTSKSSMNTNSKSLCPMIPSFR